MKILKFYKTILSIIILLSIFIYFYIDSSYEERIHDLYIRYKDSYQSYLILNDLHSGEKLKVGNINFRPIIAQRIIQYVRNNNGSMQCVSEKFSSLILNRISVGAYPVKYKIVNYDLSKCKHLYITKQETIPKSCITKNTFDIMKYAICNN